MRRSAIFSPCGLYRYELRRHWGAEGSDNMMPFVAANPSVAGAIVDGVEIDDPTAKRVVSFGQREGADGVIIVNVAAFVATEPKDLRLAADPIGPDNHAHLLRIAKAYGQVVCAWGGLADPAAAAETVRVLLGAGAELWCLGTTQAGQPRHPLYLRGDTPLERWHPQESLFT